MTNPVHIYVLKYKKVLLLYMKNKANRTKTHNIRKDFMK